MWMKGWRDEIWSQLDKPWDLIVVGGGITGAGILREAVRAGLRTLLVERNDFASGTSSRSTKMVHGGLRYLKNAQLQVTYESVGERQRLLREGAGLIKRTGFIFASQKGDPTPGWLFEFGLTIYDLMAGQWTHQRYNAADTKTLCPILTTPILLGGYRYFDAQVDDARLVLRVTREAVRNGGTALNYARAEGLLRGQDGRVRGIALRDMDPQGSGRTCEVQARLVISATGAWADELRGQMGKPARIRPLRGSHLIFPLERIPLQRAISWAHPADGRYIIAMPWEGVTLVGTTDIDHTGVLPDDPSISPEEVRYLLDSVQAVFPEQKLTLADVRATYAGIRPVIDTGMADPSKESREYLIWKEDGLVTVSGGKMTTFRLMARDTLRAARPWLPGHRRFDVRQRVLDPLSNAEGQAIAALPLNITDRLRLLGRYAADIPALSAAAQAQDWQPVGESDTLWAELRWAARAEGVVHLDDLLLRRTRLGLLLPHGGFDQIEALRKIVQPELGWSNDHWNKEVVSYKKIWATSYSLPV